LAFFQCLAPLTNLVLSSWLLKMTVPVFVAAVFKQASWLEIADFFLLPPLAGAAIFAFRPWSYAVFVGITSWNILYNLNVWWQFPQLVSLPILLSAHAVNIGLVTYFLLPAVRAAYFNPKLRWWESKPRFFVDIPATFDDGEGDRRCVITDLSEGGAFITTSRKLEADENIHLTFSFVNLEVKVEARVVHRRWQGTRGYGLQFVPDERSEQTLHRLTAALQMMGAPQRSPKDPFWAGFKSWLVSLFRTGKGWVPELPQQKAQSDSSDSRESSEPEVESGKSESRSSRKKAA
jgi:hypothetical protein